MAILKVQDCGCIALPEEVAAATGLNPGATLSIEPTEPHPPATGEQCN